MYLGVYTCFEVSAYLCVEVSVHCTCSAVCVYLSLSVRMVKCVCLNLECSTRVLDRMYLLRSMCVLVNVSVFACTWSEVHPYLAKAKESN